MKRRHPRDIGLVPSGAGKGDAERSPGWRKNYDAIDWPSGGKGPKKFRKIYGPHKTTALTGVLYSGQ